MPALGEDQPPAGPTVAPRMIAGIDANMLAQLARADPKMTAQMVMRNYFDKPKKSALDMRADAAGLAHLHQSVTRSVMGFLMCLL